MSQWLHTVDRLKSLLTDTCYHTVLYIIMQYYIALLYNMLVYLCIILHYIWNKVDIILKDTTDTISFQSYSASVDTTKHQLSGIHYTPCGQWQDDGNASPVWKFSSMIDRRWMIMSTGTWRPAAIQYQRPGHSMVRGVLQSYWFIMVMWRGLLTTHHQLKLQDTWWTDMHCVGYKKASVTFLKLAIKPKHRTLRQTL